MTLMDLFVAISADTSKLEAGIEKTKGLVGTVGSGVSKAMKVAGTAIVGATTAAAGFAAASVKVGATFDSSMAQVAATMGKTVDEIGELRAFAQEMGAKTAFSATQAADALNYMALAGYDAETSMKMLPNVLNLAAAGGMELAMASDMVTDTQSALGLSLDETAALVDKMAKASSKSNTSVEQLGSAMLTVGGTAKVLKGGTTELSTALGILADNGTKGAEGGTALRNVLSGLQSSKFEKTFGALGVSAYDAQGNMRDLKDIFADMNQVMGEFTSEERTNIINETFNKQDLKNVNALLDTTTDRWNELSAAIDDSSGAAQKMADTQLDNLAGDVTLFKSALEGAQIQISDALTPSLREFVQLGTNKLGELTSFIANGGLTESLDKIKGLFNRITEAISPLTSKIGELTTSEEAAQGVTTLLSGGLDLFIGALTLSAQTIADVISGVQSFVEWFNSGATSADVFKAVLIALTAGFVAFKAVTLATTVAQNAEVILLWAQCAALDAVAVAQKLLNAVMAANPIGLVIAAITALVAAFIYLWNTNEDFRNFWIGLWDSVVKTCKNVVDAIVKFFTETLPTAIVTFFTQTLPNGINTAINFLSQLPDKMAYWAGYAIGMFIKFIAELPSKIWNIFTTVISKAVQFGNNFSTKARETATTFLNNMVNNIKNLPANLWSIFTSVIGKATELASNLGNKAIEMARGFVNNLISGVSSLPSKFGEIGSQIVNGLWSGIKGGWDWLKDKVSDLANSLFQGAKDALGIHSPSRKFKWIGQMIDEGLASGIDKFSYLVDGSLGDLGVLDYVNNAQPQVALAGSYGSGDYNQTINIYSPTALTPSEVARQTRNATRDMVLELRGKR